MSTRMAALFLSASAKDNACRYLRTNGVTVYACGNLTFVCSKAKCSRPPSSTKVILFEEDSDIAGRLRGEHKAYGTRELTQTLVGFSEIHEYRRAWKCLEKKKKKIHAYGTLTFTDCGTTYHVIAFCDKTNVAEELNRGYGAKVFE